MTFMSFVVDDQSTEATTQPAIWIRLEEAADGRIEMTVQVQGGIVGDLRGLFFDLADESLIGSITANAAPGLTEIRQGNDTVRDLGNGANMNGLLGTDRGFDVGLEIGSAGIAQDDIRSFSVIVSSTLRPLTLADFANVDFGVRVTSVGTEGGVRSGSSKLLETTFTPITAQADVDEVDEDDTEAGNLLDNDRVGLPVTDNVAVTGWSGGSLGETVTLDDTEGATLVVNADGSYTLDATASDALSAGESRTFTFAYDTLHTAESTAWSGDSSTFTVTVHGVNDSPDAVDDDGGTLEEGASTPGNVLTNDSDVDRLDTLSVLGAQDGLGNFSLGVVNLASGATVQIAEDGSYTYNAGSAFDDLEDGETASDSFTYQITDGRGGYDTATVTLSVMGSSDSTDPGTGGGGGGGGGGTPVVDQFPTMRQAISNVVLYLDDGDPSTPLMKVKITPEYGLQLLDVDLLNIPQFLVRHASTELNGHNTLVALSIHAGQEYPTEAGQDGTHQGEGVFYLMTGDATPIVPVGSNAGGGGWTADWSVDDYPLTQAALDLGLTVELLGQAVDEEFIFNGTW